MNMYCKNDNLAKMRALRIAQRLLQQRTGITNSEIYNIDYDLDTEDIKLSRQKPTMNEDIKNFPIFILRCGKLVRYHFIKSTDDYNHYNCNLHHFIPKQSYNKDPQKYKDLGIEQKLILLPIPIHEQLHDQGIKPLSDKEFRNIYKIERSELIYGKGVNNDY